MPIGPSRPLGPCLTVVERGLVIYIHIALLAFLRLQIVLLLVILGLFRTDLGMEGIFLEFVGSIGSGLVVIGFVLYHVRQVAVADWGLVVVNVALKVL